MLEIERLKRSNALLKSQLAEAEARQIDTNDRINKLQGIRSNQPWVDPITSRSNIFFSIKCVTDSYAGSLIFGRCFSSLMSDCGQKAWKPISPEFVQSVMR